jgi:phosphatidylserine/phosphatidylglycerophosphate/cardiolipin synthase-like enzyme
MRLAKPSTNLSVKVVAGTRVVLMALDMPEQARAGLRGFAFKRGVAGSGKPADWLTGIKYFKDLVPHPKRGAQYSTRQHPIQGFLWSDYAAEPNTTYEFTVIALYGDIHAMEERYSVSFSIKTEAENDGHHGIWFNRGAIASHALATEFQNAPITKKMFNNVDTNGVLGDKEVRWLSRGLAEACLAFINGAKPGESLRVCAYEFTYAPILDALKRALDRGVDVRIVYHLTSDAKDSNAAAVKAAGLPKNKGSTQVLFERTRPKIPHNKFIVKLVADKPRSVWTGSTNFTDTGFFGQTNVGHLVMDPDTAATYLKYWQELSANPAAKEAVANATALTPNPKNAIALASIAEFYSPRSGDEMLEWYAQRIEDASNLAIMTIPFNVAPAILAGLKKQGPALRLVILEDPPSNEVTQAEVQNKGRLVFSNGALLGKNFIKYKAGGAKVVPITHSKLEEWFVDEELARPLNNGHVFFVHSKFLIIDALSVDPLVCSGSANFSTGSLTTNDENMVLIRGDTRVADIYLTEFDRIFRHFYARDAINRFVQHGDTDNPLLLDTTDNWIAPNFRDGSYKNSRRLMFFADGSGKTWAQRAADDPDPFKDAVEHAKGAKQRKAPAKARRGTAKGSKTGSKKAATKARTSKRSVKRKPAKSARRPRKTPARRR